MASKAKSETVSSKPLFAWFKLDRANRVKLKKAGYTDGRITNWKSRGIPRAEVPAVASLMGLSYEGYMQATGAAPMLQASHGLKLDIEEAESVKRLRDALPEWRAYVLNLAMTTSRDKQRLWLEMMNRPPAADEAIERAFGQAPHVAARGHELARVKDSTKPREKRRAVKNS